MIAVVTGGRDYQPTPADLAALDAAIAIYGVTRIRCGGARGVDVTVELHLCARSFPVERWGADWDRFGKAAGIRRNTGMLTGDWKAAVPDGSQCASRAGVLFAFPGGRGTAHCASEALRLGIEIVRINPSSPAKP